jgi:basic membrane protein A
MAKAKLGVNTIALQSNSSADYLPNLATAVREGANIVSAAGYLLAPTLSTVASQFPNTDFTITDDSVKGPDFAKAKSVKNIEGLVYASNESGCLVGYLAGEMVKAHGGKQVIGAVGGIEIPAVDDYIVGYAHCAAMADPGIKVLVGYSQDFVAQDKCKTVAQNQIGQGSQVEFQVAGLCGLGALNAAAQAGIWGIGVDVDQYNLAKNVLTSALKRVDVGIYDAIQQAKTGKFKGGSNLLFDLKDNGVGVGKISPKVPAAFVTKMKQLEAKIAAGTVKVPVAKGSDLLGLLPGATVGQT